MLMSEVVKLKPLFSNVEGDSNIEGHLNLTSNKLYKINNLQIDSNDILYLNTGTELLKTKIDNKQDSFTFGKLNTNALKLEADIVSNDILFVGTNNIIGKNDSELKTLICLNLVDNTSDINKPVSIATTTQLALKQNNLTFGKLLGNSLKLEEDIVSNDILFVGSNNIIGKSYSELKTLLSLNLVENIGVSSLGGTNLTYNTTTDKLDLDSTITGNITFNNDITISQDLTLTGSFIGQINAYITTSQANHDQPIVCYQASGGIVPVPPANLALIIPTTNIITVNSSTGLLKSKSIQVDGNITGVTNLNTTTLPCSNLNLTNFTSDTIYNTTLNTTTINAVTIDASSSYQLDGVDTNGLRLVPPLGRLLSLVVASF